MKAPARRTVDAVLQCIAANLDDPTHEMRVAFRRLSELHKVLLFALIDADESSPADQASTLSHLFEALSCSEDESDLEQLVRELSEGFIRVERTHDENRNKRYERVTWIHPSCRDLAIEELSRSRRLRRRFLEVCSIRGIELAMSIGGGATGARKFPLLQETDDFRIFEQRCRHLLKTNSNLLSALASTLDLLGSSPTSSIELTALRKVARRLIDAFAASVTHWHT